MADILTIFNISMADLGAFTLTELTEWRERARQRSGADE